MIPNIRSVCMLEKTDNMEKTAAVWKKSRCRYVYDTTVEINQQYLVWKQETVLCFYSKVHNVFVWGTTLS